MAEKNSIQHEKVIIDLNGNEALIFISYFLIVMATQTDVEIGVFSLCVSAVSVMSDKIYSERQHAPFLINHKHLDLDMMD